MPLEGVEVGAGGVDAVHLGQRGARRAMMVEERVVEVEENRAQGLPSPAIRAGSPLRAPALGARRAEVGLAPVFAPPVLRPPLGLDRGCGLACGVGHLALLADEQARRVEQIEQPFVRREQFRIGRRPRQLFAQAVGGRDDVGALPALQRSGPVL